MLVTLVRKRAVNRWIIVGLSAGGAFLGSAALVDYLLDPGPPVGERVESASHMIMQIDSFLAAGYIVGFFQFQEDMANRIRDAKFLIKQLGDSLRQEDLPFWLRHGAVQVFVIRKISPQRCFDLSFSSYLECKPLAVYSLKAQYTFETHYCSFCGESEACCMYGIS